LITTKLFLLFFILFTDKNEKIINILFHLCVTKKYNKKKINKYF